MTVRHLLREYTSLGKTAGYCVLYLQRRNIDASVRCWPICEMAVSDQILNFAGKKKPRPARPRHKDRLATTRGEVKQQALAVWSVQMSDSNDPSRTSAPGRN